MDHPNILKIYEYFEEEDSINLITEYCDQGDLYCKLENTERFYFDEIIVKLLMNEILVGVAYLHASNVFHGDLKLENILIVNNNYKRVSFNTSCKIDIEEYKQKMNRTKTYSNLFSGFQKYGIKIIDFGCSKIFTRNRRKFSGLIGSIYYIAPEVIDGIYDEKADMWSCGVILYTLLSGEAPFYATTDSEVLNLIREGKLVFSSHFDDISSSAKDLIKKLLTKDPKKRLSAKEALEHDFFRTQFDPRKIFNADSSNDYLSNLKNQKNKKKFYQAVMAYISHNFGVKDEINKLAILFKSVDVNHDGKISKEELYDAYKNAKMEITIDEIENIINNIDNDGNGYIEYEEFVRYLIKKENLFTENNLKAAFDFFDQDQTGTITFSEMKTIIFRNKQYNEIVFDEFLAEIGKTRTDTINFEEFKDIMKDLNNE